MQGNRARKFVAIAALVVVALAGVSAAQVTGLYYQEIAKDGRIYVFNTYERYRAFQQTGEMGVSITLIGRGPNGETVVAENDAAIDLFLFKHNLPAYDRPAPKPAPSAPPSFPQVKVGGTMYLSYQNGKAAGADYSRFSIKRAYINVNAQITSFLAARITPDVVQDAATGQYSFRVKYAYGLFSTPELGFIAKPGVEFGMVHTPWIDFDESINVYRMQDTTFIERIGILSSADAGVTAQGYFGGEMSDDYQKNVSNRYAGRYGSFQIGYYNGGGYAAAEKNRNKVIEGRITIRPLPDAIPGLQVSYFGISGKGNLVTEPDWKLNSGALSLQSTWATLDAIYEKGTGNGAGSSVDKNGRSLDHEGWSVFAEGKFTRTWSVIARYDYFKGDVNTPTTETRRTLGGVAYHFGRQNDILLDYDQLTYNDPAKPKDYRTQLTLQINF